jgi:hypothetical protein
VFFMPARPHAAPLLETMELGSGDAGRTTLDPSILRDDTALFVAQLAAPQAQHAWAEDTFALKDAESGSRADVSPSEAGDWIVHQYGPHRLWDAVEQAIATWQEAGRPHQSGFGLTVTAESQWVWLGEPDGPCWNLPA